MTTISIEICLLDIIGAQLFILLEGLTALGILPAVFEVGEELFSIWTGAVCVRCFVSDANKAVKICVV